ncbi:HD domain-containing phosphohydrolase [Terasakiella sp. SH-1]|uniref:response regulator n=1 Tax=Terasakiella sp. SH-1 TaxID=2560057 RepID=UPI0010731AE3|nr:HD domain-containing phosphohydrolase [Terasakiella sp. SH-1]
MTDNPKIIVCDDSKTNIAMAQALLTSCGFEDIRTTIDPRNVRGMIEEGGCDLLLLDLEMPHMTGFDVINQIRQDMNNQSMQILMLTGKLGIEPRNEALRIGANDFVNKPFDPTEVSLRVKNLVTVYQTQARQRRMNEILEEAVIKRTEQLNRAADDLLSTLARAGEYRDSDTGKHVSRVSHYTYLLAKAYGVEEKQAKMFAQAAPVHDIGKIGVSDTILHKPGPLTDEEREAIKKHCEIGAEILSGYSSEIVLIGQRIALTHHERWDGAGYPQGIAGEKIPLEGRIVSIADVFDALTTKRPYKEAWSAEKAFFILEEESGKAFEPKLVSLFIENRSKVEEIMNNLRDI